MGIFSFLSIFKPRGPICQSCSMPLKQDPKKGGTEVDGSISREYCSYCYEGGKFHNPSMTLEQMQAKVEEVLREMKVPMFVIKGAAASIPRLKRWRKS